MGAFKIVAFVFRSFLLHCHADPDSYRDQHDKSDNFKCPLFTNGYSNEGNSFISFRYKIIFLLFSNCFNNLDITTLEVANSSAIR